jgi:hypothetical protein
MRWGHRGWVGSAVVVFIAVSCGDGGPTVYEGDDPGECDDRVDNDRDLLFDCDDPGCAGSPLCRGADADADGADTDAEDTHDVLPDIPEDDADPDAEDGDGGTDALDDDGTPDGEDDGAADTGGEGGRPRSTGDPCTSAAQCSGGLCLGKDGDPHDALFPGGYCSQNCSTGRCGGALDLCVNLLGPSGIPVYPISTCMRRCERSTECRVTEGYVCRTQVPPTPSLFCYLEGGK